MELKSKTNLEARRALIKKMFRQRMVAAKAVGHGLNGQPKEKKLMGRPQSVSQADFVAAYRKAHNDDEIADALDIDPSTVYQTRKRYNLDALGEGGIPRKATDQDLRQAHADKLTLKEAAERLGYKTESAVSKRWKRMGLEAHDPPRKKSDAK